MYIQYLTKDKNKRSSFLKIENKIQLSGVEWVHNGVGLFPLYPDPMNRFFISISKC